MGEVNVPGRYTYSKEQLNIFEAIGLAGDITIHGDRKHVYLIRKNADSTVIKSIVDLTNDDDLFSNCYYIQPDDVIYIKPRKSRQWNVISTPISLILSSLTTFILILNYFN